MRKFNLKYKELTPKQAMIDYENKNIVFYMYEREDAAIWQLTDDNIKHVLKTCLLEGEGYNSKVIFLTPDSFAEEVE